MKKVLRTILYKFPLTKTICQYRIRIYEWFIIAFPYIKKKCLNPKAVFLILTPEHGNLGDHAIAQAEIDILNKLNIKYIEITGKQLGVLQQCNFLSVMNKRTILVNGGGNLGTLWPQVEVLFREIIIKNPQSKIILFPNTFYYEDTLEGKKELEKSIEIYNNHKSLILFAREKKSYDAMKKIYTNVKLVPDIVYSLQVSQERYEKKGCLLCLRHDCEKTIDSESESKVFNFISREFADDYEITDMVVNYEIIPEQRKNELNKKFEQFSRAKLVITDRLHAMIFCALVGTPCIVLNSKSPKVLGCYEWIKDLDYIKVLHNIDNINDLYSKMNVNYKLFNNNLNDKYDDLIHELKKLIK